MERGIHGKATFRYRKLKNDLEKLADQIVIISFSVVIMIEKLVSEQNISGITIVPSEVDTNELLGRLIFLSQIIQVLFDFL